MMNTTAATVSTTSSRTMAMTVPGRIGLPTIPR